MNLPPFLLGLALLFWGHQTGIWYPALLLAILLESARVVKWRFDFSDSDYARFWDLSNVLFAIAAFYCYVNRDGNNALMALFQTSAVASTNSAEAGHMVYIFFQWWPLVFFPMAAAQAFGARAQIPASVFVWLLRGRAPGHTPELTANIGYPYLGICLLAAGVANRRDAWFYLGFCLIAGIALWVTQPRRASNVLWFALLLLIAKLGYWGHIGLNTSQAAIENAVSNFVARYAGRSTDLSESRTNIGRFGKLKLSGRLVMTVAGTDQLPSLLRDASYTLFKTPTWTLTSRDYNAVTQEIDAATWNLQPIKTPNHEVTLTGFFSRVGGFLPLPHGAMQIENLPEANLTTNRFGAVRTASGGSDFFNCRVRYGKLRTIDSPPDLEDRLVPNFETNAIAIMHKELQLDGLSELKKIKVITDLFTTDFHYTLYQAKGSWSRPDKSPNPTPLARFLLRTKAGHCEHFATATVLLLRQAGIPARYATGFAVSEPERGNTGRFLVRERHAHAWCIYFSETDHAWHELDTTPANWLEAEKEKISAWEPFSDFFTRLWFRFNQWRQADTKNAWQTYALWLVAALTAILLYRLLRNKRRAHHPDAAAAAEKLLWPGADSDFYQIEQHLRELGLHRAPGEPPAAWLRRIAQTPELAYSQLQPILELHYRYRFDPRGLTPAARAQLRLAVQSWLQSPLAGADAQRL